MLEITNIRNGAILNHSNGKETDDYLEIMLECLTDTTSNIRVNGIIPFRVLYLFWRNGHNPICDKNGYSKFLYRCDWLLLFPRQFLYVGTIAS